MVAVPRTSLLPALLLLGSFLATGTTHGGEPERITRANYKQAAHFSTSFLQQFIHDTSVRPNFIGKTDTFWYSFRTSDGTRFWRVDPRQATRVPLFDHVKLATLISEATQKPFDAALFPISRPEMNEEGTKLKFVVERTQFEFDLAEQKLTKLGTAAPARTFPGRFGGQRRQEGQQQQQQDDVHSGLQLGQGQQRQLPPGGPPRPQRENRIYSPDRKAYVVIRDHNLYLAENGGNPLHDLMLSLTPRNVPGILGAVGLLGAGVSAPRDVKPMQLSKDSVENYSFGSMRTFGAGMDDDIPPPRVEWSTDSRHFYATRVDTRGVQDLFVVDSLASPRPKLESYGYPMPGETAVRKMELFVCDRSAKKLIQIPPRWKDESFTHMHWGKTSDELRFLRRDRLQRHVELCSLDVKTGKCVCLIPEGFEDANVNYQQAIYVDESDEMIWWSERSGWGHFYLCDRNGKFKNAITSGLYQALQMVAVDGKNRLFYFRANGREPGENLNYPHLYCVHFDGTGLTLLDPGDAYHRSVLTPSRQFVIDNYSRVDLAPAAVLRDAAGKQILKLEATDLSRLQSVGWKMPERFVVKAADGVTDLYGNLWKPFDFDPTKKYPIVVNVYPGPQTEGVTHFFMATGSNQQLAQLGFIVLQVGHRGGTPNRSKAYSSFGYNNLRDYGLADKKAAIEQLAARRPYLDLDRVGIFGHSGGGFMSAAAVLQKPYNEFFKAAVASAGNHDNNIYNNGWAERYHGMKEVTGREQPPPTGTRSESGSTTDGTGTRRQGFGQRGGRFGRQGTTERQPSERGSESESAADEKRFEIKVPTNAELAANLKGALLLVHGEMDNNVHPANTMRLVDALIKANKRFDMLILPGKRHGYGDAQAYFQKRSWDFFADHLIGDRQTGADIFENRETP